MITKREQEAHTTPSLLYGQYFMHAHSHTNRASAAMDTMFEVVHGHNGYVIVMGSNKEETAVHSCHWPGDTA